MHALSRDRLRQTLPFLWGKIVLSALFSRPCSNLRRVPVSDAAVYILEQSYRSNVCLRSTRQHAPRPNCGTLRGLCARGICAQQGGRDNSNAVEDEGLNLQTLMELQCNRASRAVLDEIEALISGQHGQAAETWSTGSTVH